MHYDIHSVDHTYKFLSAVTDDTPKALSQNWFFCDEDIDEFIKLYSTQIASWDIESTDFVIKHVTSSCCELEDIKAHGILYLPDVIKADTFLNKLLNRVDFVIDVDAHKLKTDGKEYELDWEVLLEQPLGALFREELIQISRTLYRDYISTFLHCSNPFAYGNGLGMHPEFMDYFARIPPNGKKIMQYWDTHSKGFLITAKVPFSKASHVSFGIENEAAFIEDSNKGYKRCKKHLIQKACEIALQGYDRECYLFLKHHTRIPPNDFIRIDKQHIKNSR